MSCANETKGASRVVLVIREVTDSFINLKEKYFFKK